MSYRPQDNVFITYSSPEEFKSKKNRRVVSSVASKSYRATSKKIVLEKTLYRPLTCRPTSTQSSQKSGSSQKDVDDSGTTTEKSPVAIATAPSQQAVESIRAPTPLDDRPLGSPLVDPFISYPVPEQPYIPFLVDYFIRFLTPRFSPALNVDTSRYLVWFNVSLRNAELFHALVALSQVYYNIDVRGFGQPHWTSLYHRGQSLKLLRRKVETSDVADDDAAILTALWLMDVDAANDDLHAYAMHKRAKERMVFTRGGIRKLHPDLQDELLKSEFFLPLFLYGRFVCKVIDDQVLVRFKEFHPLDELPNEPFWKGFAPVFSKGLLSRRAVDIMHHIAHALDLRSRQKSSESSLSLSAPIADIRSALPSTPGNEIPEMNNVLQIAESRNPQTHEHRVLLALLIYIFNVHLRPDTITRRPVASESQSTEGAVEPKYLDILSSIALEISQPTRPQDPNWFTEREVTLWTVITIGAAASFSPWRLEIPFMGHIIELMQDDDPDRLNTLFSSSNDSLDLDNHSSNIRDIDHGPETTARSYPRKKKESNLDKLAAQLRGYYLYGADKNTLRSLRRWND